MSRTRLVPALARRTSVPGALLAAILVLTAVVTVQLARSMWFFGDDWAFLVERRASLDPEVGLLVPHNEHWSTMPLLAFRLMFSLVGLKHFALFAAMPVLVHVAACGLMFALLRRHALPAWPAMLAVTIMSLPGAGAEDILWSFQIGFLGSALWGLVALLLLSGDRTGWRWTAAAWAALVVSLMCSGMALPITVWVGIYLLLRRGLVAALVTTVPVAVVYLLWYATYGRDATAQAPRATLQTGVQWFWHGLGHVGDALTGAQGLGLLIVAGLLAAVLMIPGPAPTKALALSGLGGVAAMYALLAVSRAGLGIPSAEASRYVWFGVMFLTPAFGFVLQVLARTLGDRPVLRATMAGLLVTALAVQGVAATLAFRQGRLSIDGDLAARTVAAADLAEGGDQLLSSDVDPFYAPDLSVQWLRRPEVRSALPRLRPDAKAVLDARAALQVAAVADGPLPVPMARSLVASSGLPGQQLVDGCVRAVAQAGAWVLLPGGETGSQARLTVNTQLLDVTLVLPGQRRSSPVLRRIPAGEPVWVGTSVEDSRLFVAVPAGPVSVCLAGSRP